MHIRKAKMLAVVATVVFATTAPLSFAPVLAQSSATTATAAGAYNGAIASSVRVLARRKDGSATYGTGWVIQATDNENRAGAAVVVTARHVIAGADKVTIVESGSDIDDQKPATVIGGTVDQDIAFLEVKDLAKPPLQLTRARPDVGGDIAAAGYTTASDTNETEGRAKSASLKRGGLSKYYRGPVNSGAQAPIDQLEFDAPILSGFSGGPLLNQCGRVIGMTITDGGHIRIAEGASVAVAQGVSTAVAADEIIRAARATSIEVNVTNTACGEAVVPPPPPPPPAPCSEPYKSVDAAGKVCTPIEPTASQKLMHGMKGPIGLVVALGVLALLVIFGTIFWLVFRRRPRSSQFGTTSIVSGEPPAGGSILLSGTHKPSSVAATLRLTGRGPDGEPIDLRYSASDLAGGGVMLGVEGDPTGRIPDKRPTKFVGRSHARLAFDGRNYTVEDNKSLNGTKVGGVKLEPYVKRVLVSGDTVTLADVALHVTID